MMVRNPGGGYGFNLNRVSDAISRYTSTRFLMQKPYGIINTISSVGRYFFGATKAQLATIRKKGELAFQAGKKLARLLVTESVSRGQIPVDTTLPPGTAYRAKVIIKTIDPFTKSIYYRTVTLDFVNNPTFQDIFYLVQAIDIPMSTSPSPTRGPQPTEPPLPTLIEVHQVISITRRTY